MELLSPPFTRAYHSRERGCHPGVLFTQARRVDAHVRGFTSDEKIENSPIQVSLFRPDAGVPSPPQAFTPPLDEPELRDLRWYLELYAGWPMGEDKARAERIEAGLEDWGRALLDSALQGKNAPRLWQQFVDAEDESKLLTLDATDPRVLRLPWELLADESGHLFTQGVGCAGRFPGGAAFVSFEHGGSLQQLCSWVGQAVSGDPDFSLGENDPVAAIGQLLAEHPSLVILDNFESVLGREPQMPVEELRVILDAVWAWAGGAKGKGDGAAGSRMLITTRDTTFADDRFAPSQACAHLGLEGLAMPDALDLAAAVLDAHGRRPPGAGRSDGSPGRAPALALCGAAAAEGDERGPDHRSLRGASAHATCIRLTVRRPTRRGPLPRASCPTCDGPSTCASPLGRPRRRWTLRTAWRFAEARRKPMRTR